MNWREWIVMNNRIVKLYVLSDKMYIPEKSNNHIHAFIHIPIKQWKKVQGQWEIITGDCTWDK